MKKNGWWIAGGILCLIVGSVTGIVYFMLAACMFPIISMLKRR